MTDYSVYEISAGDVDATVQLCEGGAIELGLTDGVEGMYGQLDIEGAEQLIARLQAAVRAARGA